ncbi:MAG: glycosyltransferase family 61 protein [Protaetiibacter sp.]
MSRASRALAEAITTHAVAFRRDNDPAHLTRIRELVDALGPAGLADPAKRRVRYTGWVALPFRVSRARLRAANPAYRVAVAHPVRPELGPRGRVLRFGFEVTATGPLDAPPFSFFVSRGSESAGLRASNDLGRHQLERAGGDVAVRDDITGYLDSIRQWSVSSAPGDRLGDLAQEYPELLWDFLESDASEGLREYLTTSLARFPTNDRWADRYRLATHRVDSAFASDLTLLRVERPELAGPAATALPLPELVVSGDRAEAHAGPRMLPTPPTGWLTVEDAALQDGGTVTAGGRLFRYEASADPALDFVAGQWTTTFGSARNPDGVLLRRPDTAADPIEEGVLLSGRNDANWFHWTVEYLPRVLDIPAHISPEVPLIVTPRVPDTGLQALAELSDRPLVFVDPDHDQPIRRLHVAAPPVQVLDTTRVPWSDGLSINRAPLDAMRRLWGVDTARETPGRRVFVSRRSRHRGITNEEELVRIAERHGLEVVDPSELDFAGQRELFSGAEVLVGASGAVMANYLLMRPGSRILAMTSRQLADFVLPAALAAVADCSFGYLLGESDVRLEDLPDRLHWIHADFTVRPEAFDRALDDFL